MLHEQGTLVGVVSGAGGFAFAFGEDKGGGLVGVCAVGVAIEGDAGGLDNGWQVVGWGSAFHGKSDSDYGLAGGVEVLGVGVKVGGSAGDEVVGLAIFRVDLHFDAREI